MKRGSRVIKRKKTDSRKPVAPAESPGNREKIVRQVLGLGVPIVLLHGVKPNRKCRCGKTNCHSPGKHPIHRVCPKGVKSAIHDLDEALQAIKDHPQANLAVAPGGEARLVVLDIDAKIGGLETLDELEEEHGKIPQTVKYRTGGGDFHYWFTAPVGVEVRNSAGALGKGIDIRAEGGLAVIPPSRHASGKRYRFIENRQPGQCKIAPMPDWLLDENAFKNPHPL